MKKTVLILTGAALLCVISFLLPADYWLRLLPLPLTGLGKALRFLSLSGSTGNILSIILWLVTGLLPLALAMRKQWSKENFLLIVACVILIYSLYYMVNPGLRPINLRNEVGDLILSCSFYSVMVCWAVIKFLRSSDKLDTASICKVLEVFLWICAAECILLGTAGTISELRLSLAALATANTIPGQQLLPTQLFLVLSACVTSLEYWLDAYVLTLSIHLLKHLAVGPYDQKCCAAAGKTVKGCKRSLLWILLSHSGLNITMLFFAKYLYNLNVSFRFPLISLAIIFAIMGLSHLLEQGRKLKEDNDLFI